VLLVLCAAAQALAAPFAVRVGEARIGLDAPAGFADTGFTGSPRLQELAEAQTSASNRILLFAISDGDLRRFMVGDTPEFRRYMIVVTPKALEREHVAEAAFQRFVADALRGLGEPPANVDLFEYLDARPPGQSSILGELRRDPGVVSVVQGSRLPPQRRNEKPQYVLASTSFLLVRGKPLNLSVYSVFESAADLDWLRATTLRWVEDLQRLNPR
jgi:hypothetical protein